MPSGGSRPRTAASRMGRPKGTTGIKHKSTISKEEGRELVRQEVLKNIQPMIAAQVKHAQGLNYLVARHRTSGKFVKLTKALADSVLSGEDDTHELLEIWEKDPSTPAFTDLLNRALDKPKEQEQEVTVAGKLVIEIAKGW